MQPTPEMMAQLNNPSMMGMAQRMMAGMEPEQLADAMRQSGMDVTPEQAAQMKTQVRPVSTHYTGLRDACILDKAGIHDCTATCLAQLVR